MAPGGSKSFAQRIEKEFVTQDEIDAAVDDFVFLGDLTNEARFDQGSDGEGCVVLRKDVLHKYTNKSDMAGVRLATMLDGGGVDVMLISILNEIGCNNGRGKFFFVGDCLPKAPTKAVKPADFVYRNEVWSIEQRDSYWNLTPLERICLFGVENLAPKMPVLAVTLFYLDETSSAGEIRIRDQPLAQVILLFRDMKPHLISKIEWNRKCHAGGSLDSSGRSRFKQTWANKLWLERHRLDDMSAVSSALERFSGKLPPTCGNEIAAATVLK
jgi:hypothetical protein